MSYIARDMEPRILALSKEYSCVLLTGPRQVGKTTMLRHVMEPGRSYVTLDDWNERRLAQADPAMFLALHRPPVLIDEVQYAPALFSALKQAVDEGAPPGSFWLTGSQAFSMMELAQESLAGRAAVLEMSSLSQHELCGTGENAPFSLDLEALHRRRAGYAPADVHQVYERIWLGSLPGLRSGRYTDWEVFYSSYLQTYIGRDIRDLTERVDAYQFQDFIRAVACRVGQMLNVHSLALDVGVSDGTARRWLALLERSAIIFYLHPYGNNLLKRTVKQPKLYFFDTGLVAYLTGYSTPDILEKGALNGAILENYAAAELRKNFLHNGRMPRLWYYRDKDGHEIDLVLEQDGVLHPLEVKRTMTPDRSMVQSFRMLEKGERPVGRGAVLCMAGNITALDGDTLVVPIWML